MGEAHLSAQQSPPEDEARLPPSDQHASRPGNSQGPPRQGARPPVGLIARIHGRRAFDRFRTEGRRQSAGDLWCSVIADPTLDGAHVAYTITRSVGPAVVRNRVRRRLRHLVASSAERWAPGWYLIGVRPGAAHRSYEELSEMLQRVLNRIEQAPR